MKSILIAIYLLMLSLFFLIPISVIENLSMRDRSGLLFLLISSVIIFGYGIIKSILDK